MVTSKLLILDVALEEIVKCVPERMFQLDMEPYIRGNEIVSTFVH